MSEINKIRYEYAVKFLMNYPKSANIINIAFAAIFFCLPIIIALNNVSLSKDTGNFLILLSFILLALALMDWYHLYFSNTYKGIIYNFSLFSSAALCSVLLTKFLSGYSFIQLASLTDPEQWVNYNILFKAYIVSFGIALISILSVPRLLLIKTITKQPLPSYGSTI
ncbi:MAG: hypothetical protein KAG18_04740 [Sinobacterium sp.]|nr:hypothetical protein [Sinobacterium sp.]